MFKILFSAMVFLGLFLLIFTQPANESNPKQQSNPKTKGTNLAARQKKMLRSSVKNSSEFSPQIFELILRRQNKQVISLWLEKKYWQFLLKIVTKIITGNQDVGAKYVFSAALHCRQAILLSFSTSASFFAIKLVIAILPQLSQINWTSATRSFDCRTFMGRLIFLPLYLFPLQAGTRHILSWFGWILLLFFWCLHGPFGWPLCICILYVAKLPSSKRTLPYKQIYN